MAKYNLTEKEIEKLRENDPHSYELLKNNLFLIFLSEKIKDGYKQCGTIKQMQSLVDDIVSFYESQYPDISIESTDKKIEFDELYNNVKEKQFFNEFEYEVKLNHEYIEEIKFQCRTNALLRNMLFTISAVKMIYSPNTIPSYGYERAIKFIDLVNKHYNINITTNFIDKLMETDHYKDIQKRFKIDMYPVSWL